MFEILIKDDAKTGFCSKPGGTRCDWQKRGGDKNTKQSVLLFIYLFISCVYLILLIKPRFRMNIIWGVYILNFDKRWWPFPVRGRRYDFQRGRIKRSKMSKESREDPWFYLFILQYLFIYLFLVTKWRFHMINVHAQFLTRFFYKNLAQGLVLKVPCFWTSFEKIVVPKVP